VSSWSLTSLCAASSRHDTTSTSTCQDTASLHGEGCGQA
jgi:hypothetical protein